MFRSIVVLVIKEGALLKGFFFCLNAWILASFFLGLILISLPKCNSMTRNGEINGVVLDTSGKPISDVVVIIEKGPSSFPDIAALTDQKGRFSFKDLTPGRYVLLLNSERFAPKEIEVEAAANAKEVQVKLEPEKN